MANTTLSPVTQQRIAVLVPIIALILSLFVVYPAYGRYGQKRGEIAKKQGELTTLIGTPLPPETAANPTVENSPSEPPQFFGEISRVARAAQCKMVGYDLSSSGGTEAEKESPVRALRGKVELEATYPEIRAFLFELSKTERLFVVTDMDITAGKAASGPAGRAVPVGDGLLHATIEIERYVAPPVTAAASPAK